MYNLCNNFDTFVIILAQLKKKLKYFSDPQKEGRSSEHNRQRFVKYVPKYEPYCVKIWFNLLW